MMTPENFQAYKTLSAVLAFAFSCFWQFALPNIRPAKRIFENWATNFPLGLVGVLLVGMPTASLVWALSSIVASKRIGLLNWAGVSVFWNAVATVFLLDLSAYLWHRANHYFGFLWRFHSVHHSELVLDCTTAVRFHPVEILISTGLRLSLIFALGCTPSGLFVFELFYTGLNFFEHGNINLPRPIEKYLRMVFVTPSMHCLHHSQEIAERDTNFSIIFSFWDRLGESYRKAVLGRTILMGLPFQSQRKSLLTLLIEPLDYSKP